jgi:carboxyl-terminal processing protease
MQPTDPQRPAPRRSRNRLSGAIASAGLVLTFVAGVGVGRIGDPAIGPATPTAAPSAAASASPAQTPAGSPSADDGLALIREAWDAIHRNYVDAADLDDRALAYGAIDGLADAIGDTGHTEFMTPEERAAQSSALSGSYVGIGAEVDTTADGLPLIVGVFRGSPADGVGLHAGDVVLEVDSRPTRDEDLDTVISWIRGEAGTDVTLLVRAGDDGPKRTLRITRADVTIEPVSWTLVPGTTTAVLRLEQFSSGATPKMREAIGQLKAAGAERIVLDLRGNPGGYVNEAVAIASEFLASGNVYLSRNASGDETPSPVTPGGQATDLPLVVLVDQGSASAAEIVAGAIQDAGRGQVVGETTFGTGTVLGEFALSDGSALRIGTVEWLTPNGRVIWHEGITPDVVVERPAEVAPLVPDDLRSMTAAQVAGLADPQLSRAIQLVASAR